jgi:hypothetical protein
MNKLISTIKSTWPEIIGLAVGAAGGFVYYKTVGCSTGTCPITSNPWMSILWGSITGYLLVSMFNKNKKTEK